MNAELYVWYEALPEQEGEVLSAFAALVRVLQAKLSHEATQDSAASRDRWCDTPARLLKRADPVTRNGQLRDTWMEVWCMPDALTPAAFERLLEQACAQLGCYTLALGGRHLERFAPQAAGPASR